MLLDFGGTRNEMRLMQKQLCFVSVGSLLNFVALRENSLQNPQLRNDTFYLIIKMFFFEFDLTLQLP